MTKPIPVPLHPPQVNMGMGQTYQEVCPALLPSPMRADGYYTQPAGVGRPLQLNTNNLPEEVGVSCSDSR